MSGSEVYRTRMDDRPGVGGMVHYMSRGSADGRFRPVCRAAVVTELPRIGPDADDGAELAVDLCVLNPAGIFFDTLVDHDVHGRPGTWHWIGEHQEKPDGR